MDIVTLGVEAPNAPSAPTAIALAGRPTAETVFFRTGGVVLARPPGDLLAAEAHPSPAEPTFEGVTLAHNVRSREKVDAGLAPAAAGGQHPEAATRRRLGWRRRVLRQPR